MPIDKYSKMAKKEIDSKIDGLETCRTIVNRVYKDNLSLVLKEMNNYHFPKSVATQIEREANGRDTVTIGTSWLPIDPYEKHEFMARKSRNGLWKLSDNGYESMCHEDSKWCIDEITANEKVLNKFLRSDKETRKKMIY